MAGWVLRATLAISILVGFAGCPSPPPTPAPPAQEDPFLKEDDTLIHRKAGAVFPARIGAFERGTVQVHDTTGADLSVSYDVNLPDRQVHGTIYVYPVTLYGPDGSDAVERELSRAEAEVRQVRPAAILLDERPVGTMHNLILTPGLLARFTFAGGFGSDAPGDMRSLLYLFRQGPWFVKYRITYPEGQHAKAERDVNDFVSSMAWRQRKPSVAGIVLHSSLTLRPDRVTGAWMGYAGARSAWIDAYFERYPDAIHYAYSHEEELNARKALVETWRTLKAKSPGLGDSYLDTLLRVQADGFLAEYVWYYLRDPQWHDVPASLRMAEFGSWRRAHLKGHRPETRAAITFD